MLGSRQTEYRQNNPGQDLLETFPNDSPERRYEISLEFPEFTSLCPKTGQPDFGTIVVEYEPKAKCVETKSLKLYLFAFRGEGSFMEAIANRIYDDLMAVLNPWKLLVIARFKPRGGCELCCAVDSETAAAYED